MKTTHNPTRKNISPQSNESDENIIANETVGDDGVDNGVDNTSSLAGDETVADEQHYVTLEEIPEPLEYRIKLPDEPKPKKRKSKEEEYEQKMKNVRPYLWQPGTSGNPKGRPRNVVKEVGERIALTNASRALNAKQKQLAHKMGFDPKEITLIEALMLQLATSANPMKVALYLERTFGKVPNINLNAQLSENLVQRFKSKLTDSELEAIADGADVFEILLDKLPDVSEGEDDDTIIDASASNVYEDKHE